MFFIAIGIKRYESMDVMVMNTYVPSTRFNTSRTIRLSNSIAITLLDLSSNFTVKLPVPGPISKVISEGRILARSTILSRIIT